ncbi:MAG: gliding motility-associated C-terminal domain-containing protein [Flavobacteriales bacterium]|nr:gliding motility-associated C-terminal domain-containing protein [Flavobacteriales bacterium]
MIVPLVRFWSAPLLLVLLSLPVRLFAQVPTKCLEIESILVDACNPSSVCPGSSEGQNEMVRFRVGPEPIAIGDLEADWPNGTWRGLAQNATTASLTSQLNATITSCGQLLEPPGGIIPAGSEVLLVTSTEMCVAGNSFAGLAETIYLIFQNAGNTAGHFANSPAAGQPVSPTPPPGSGARTLIIYHNPSACSDTATYIREQLVNNVGSYGGQSGESDGGTAVFSWPGIPEATYVNYGCQAPFTPLLVQAEATGALCGGTGTVNISAEVIGGAFTTVQWTGGTGTFGDANALSTTYTAGSGDVGTVLLTLCAQTACADPICGSVSIPSGSGPTITITADGPLALCAGEDLVLSATGADDYTWGGGEATPSITVTSPGTYSVTGTNACGTGSASVEVTPASGITITITGPSQICPPATVVLTASGAPNFLWDTGATTPSITITGPGTYSVTGSSACGSTTESRIVTLGTPPSVSITGDLAICPGESTTLTATGSGSFLWSTGSTSNSITVNSTGTYSVTATNGCGTASATAEVEQSPGPVVSISGTLAVCDGQSTTLTASGADTYVWSTGATGTSITVDAPGDISVVGITACGEGDATVTIIAQQAPTVNVTGDALLCPGEQVVLTAVSVAPITWNTGATGPTITVSAAGLYVATATNGCGSDNDGFAVTASLLDAAFTPSVTSGPAPLTVLFTNATTPSGATYVWDFDGEGSSTGTSPTHLFEAQGSYTITLEATLDGCTATAVAVINVGTPPVGTNSSIVIPNVFTPNGDHQNDLLVMTAVNIRKVEVLIYNRWGQKVNELKRVGESWDARSMSGDLVPDGTYFYTLSAEGTDGKTYDMNGHITLVR